MRRALSGILILILAASCGSHKKAGTEVAERPDTQSLRSSSPASAIQRRIVDEAMEWMGTPYGYGRSDKGEATDCSGMVLVVYRDIAGVSLPRNSAMQADFSKKIHSREVTTGDLVFFATGKDPDRISHVGIMIDEDRFIHASSSKGVVISNVSSPYYTRTLRQFGRVLKF